MPTAYNFPTIKRGDTFSEKVIAVLTNTDTGDPVAIASARLQVRKRSSGTIVQEWNTADSTLTISGAGSNTLTMAEVAPDDTADWPPGTHDYDLEITLVSGLIFTAPDGTFEVSADITR